MSDRAGRTFLGLTALALLWIVVYWWWEPRPRTTFGSEAPGRPAAPSQPPAGPPPQPVSSPPATVTPAAASREPAPKRPPEKPVAVIPPQFRPYTVRDGDTIRGIALRELGSVEHASAILAANALMSPENLKAGRVIRIPLDPANIQGKPVVESPAPAPAATPAASTPETPASKGSEYVVRDGDTLSAISKRFYGTTTLAHVIFEANRNQLESEDAVRAGITLKIPPKPVR